MTDYTWIDSDTALAALADRANAAPWIAIDLEANSMFVYRERVCLVQLNLGGDLFVIDTLAFPCEPAALAPLKAALENPDIPTYVHGGEYDVGSFKRDYDITMRGIYDSQQAASLMGWPKTGYGAVVERICEVALPKGHSQYDWATRPLDPDALAYAVDDVRYLPRVIEALQQGAKDTDLEEEIAIANTVVEGATWSGGFDTCGFWRLKGIRDLANRSFPTLVALWKWRDELGEQHNLPPGRVIANELLLALARNAPTNYGLLRRLGVKGWVVQEHGEQLITVVKDALENPPAVPERAWVRETTDAERARENRLKDWRRSESERRELPLQTVLPARALEYLKQHGCEDLSLVPQLGQKRISLYQEQLRKVCR